ncbi:MAG: AAA family ATPase [Anaerolineaceae bacterium]|nr:AAA family ATPase [Anaerolineaceae bacterium]
MEKQICPNCEYENPQIMQYCIMCGTPLVKICAVCDFHNPRIARFCGMCGNELSAEPVFQSSIPEADEKPTEAALTVEEVSQAMAKTTPPAQMEEISAPPLNLPPQPRKLVGERHVATIILADVQGSTELMEKIGTESWVRVMNSIFQVLEAEIYRMGGEIDQYRGDGLVAMFGARSVHEDDPERAVLAALFMQTAFKRFSKSLDIGNANIDLKLRVGVNTGEIIVTSIGNEKHHEDTAMGGAIALAARMETAAEPGTVLVSENTYHLTSERFTFQALGEISVKGISEPVNVYRPTNVLGEDQSAYTGAIQWIGREKQVSDLKRAIHDLQRGHGSIVMINGEKGLGKSFLISHTQQEIKREGILLNRAEGAAESQPQHLTWLVGQCRSYGQSWPYSMWYDLMNYWLHSLAENSEEADYAAIFYEQAEQFWGEKMHIYCPYLASFLHLPISDDLQSYIQNLNVETFRNNFFEAVRAWLSALSAQYPVIISFSNLHWAGPTSLELLKYCLSLSDTRTIMWLMTMRPARNSAAWNFRHYISTEYPHRLLWIELPPLTVDESNQLIDQLIGADSLNEEERSAIIKRCEGNPFYLREIIYSMVDQGVLIEDEQSKTWHFNPEQDAYELPDSLHTIMQESISNLSPEERHVLQVASVMGNRFSVWLLQSILNKDRKALNRDLTNLQRAQLIKEHRLDPEMGMVYAFNSSLLRDAAYESLLLPQRSAYHLKCAEIIEERVSTTPPEGGSLSQLFSYLVQQFHLAGLYEREIEYIQRSAEAALGMHANEEALRLFNYAVNLINEMLEKEEYQKIKEKISRQQFDILLHRHELKLLLGDIEGAKEDAKTLVKMTENELADNPEARIDALLKYSHQSIGLTREDAEKMSYMCEEALYIARNIGDRRREMETLSQIAYLRGMSGNPNVHEPAKLAIEIAREIGDRNAEFSQMLTYGYFLIGQDQTEEGMRIVQQAANLVEDVDDPFAKMGILSVMGPNMERSGDYYRWLTEFEEKRLELSRQVGSRFTEGVSLMFCGQIRGVYLGDQINGLNDLEAAYNCLIGTPNHLFVMLRKAQIYMDMGEYELAQESLDQSYPLTIHNVQELARVGHKLTQLMLYNLQGDMPHLNSALDLAEEIDRLGEQQNISQQYRMAAASHASSIHRKIASFFSGQNQYDEEIKQRVQYHLEKALIKSELAVNIYRQFGYTNASEITGEWILYRMGKALIANKREEEGKQFIDEAYNEMMRKYELIPEESHYRKTYLQNIAHHRQILSAHRIL